MRQRDTKLAECREARPEEASAVHAQGGNWPQVQPDWMAVMGFSLDARMAGYKVARKQVMRAKVVIAITSVGRTSAGSWDKKYSSSLNNFVPARDSRNF